MPHFLENPYIPFPCPLYVLSGSGKSTLAKVLIGDSAYEVQVSPFSSVESIGSNDAIFIYIIYGYLMISIDIRIIYIYSAKWSQMKVCVVKSTSNPCAGLFKGWSSNISS